MVIPTATLSADASADWRDDYGRPASASVCHKALNPSYFPAQNSAAKFFGMSAAALTLVYGRTV